MKHVEIWTDGACSGNPGPGGWAAILRYGSAEKVVVPDCGSIATVSLLGCDRKVVWAQKGNDVEIEMPAFRLGAAPSEHALAFKLTSSR